MRNLATKLACATVCLLILCTGSRGQGLTDQQIAKVKDLIHDTVQPSIDAINKKIDALVGALETSHLKPQHSLQVERDISEYQTEPDTHIKTAAEERKYEDERKYGDERKNGEERKVIYINCCRPRWEGCCRPRWHHCCRPRWDNCCRPHWHHCCRPQHHYCRPRDDDP